MKRLCIQIAAQLRFKKAFKTSWMIQTHTQSNTDLCGLADSLLKKLSPLDELTENEINAIRTEIEHHETVPVIGKRQKKKSLVMLERSIIDYIDQKCWCT